MAEGSLGVEAEGSGRSSRTIASTIRPNASGLSVPIVELIKS
jgi:hypothetical protein